MIGSDDAEKKIGLDRVICLDKLLKREREILDLKHYIQRHFNAGNLGDDVCSTLKQRIEKLEEKIKNIDTLDSDFESDIEKLDKIYNSIYRTMSRRLLHTRPNLYSLKIGLKRWLQPQNYVRLNQLCVIITEDEAKGFSHLLANIRELPVEAQSEIRSDFLKQFNSNSNAQMSDIIHSVIKRHFDTIANFTTVAGGDCVHQSNTCTDTAEAANTCTDTAEAANTCTTTYKAATTYQITFLSKPKNSSRDHEYTGKNELESFLVGDPGL